PHEMPLPEIGDAIARWAAPRSERWFEYKGSEPATVAAVGRSLRSRVGIEFDAADIAMTTGAFGAIAATLRAIVDAGDEVIYLSPPWFFYPQMIMTLGATPLRVDLPSPTFELPLAAIEAAITPRTRAIIVNSPHNPTGRILQPSELTGLAEVLDRASERSGRPVYLVSDESYSRILFDGEPFHSPVRFYDRSFLIYTYGKTLLAPGQRLGYVAIPPTMPDRPALRNAILVAQVVTGYQFPNAVMQYALEDLDKASIDIAALQRRRDRVLSVLGDMGYETVRPGGTFYVLVRSPVADDVAFAALLAEHDVYVLPGAAFELPGWFRISLTANDAMVERALPGFQAAFKAATG
ncbi:MAG: aminotransferase class, partial [Actinobacteria bacterium]|nr:aminotransferase class [Actinomycetota bacterium]